MPNPFIRYRSGYKYQLASGYKVKTSIKPKKAVDDKMFIKLDKNGLLRIAAGYAWDGPSGPVIDTRENMRASLVHDAFYQLMRNKFLTAKAHKDKADRLFQKICVQDGVSRPIAKIYYHGLKYGGKPSTDPKNKKKVHHAPR